MAIKTRNKIGVSFNSSSMSDLVFLLLIFFMLTWTLVAPNAIKLLLPSSSSKTMAKQTVTVYINDLFQYYVDETPVTDDELASSIGAKIAGESDATRTGAATAMTDHNTATAAAIFRIEKSFPFSPIIYPRRTGFATCKILFL